MTRRLVVTLALLFATANSGCASLTLWDAGEQADSGAGELTLKSLAVTTATVEVPLTVGGCLALLPVTGAAEFFRTNSENDGGRTSYSPYW